jgi:hypothetical protein
MRMLLKVVPSTHAMPAYIYPYDVHPAYPTRAYQGSYESCGQPSQQRRMIKTTYK